MTIAELNDALRRSFTGGEVFITRGVRALPRSAQAAIIVRVRTFDAFGPDNDPYGEHDFGSFEYSGISIFWKIDYYDTKLEFHSPDPADPTVTTRVLTILRSEEY
jgi:hypothetical protein